MQLQRKSVEIWIYIAISDLPQAPNFMATIILSKYPQPPLTLDVCYHFIFGMCSYRKIQNKIIWMPTRFPDPWYLLHVFRKYQPSWPFVFWWVSAASYRETGIWFPNKKPPRQKSLPSFNGLSKVSSLSVIPCKSLDWWVKTQIHSDGRSLLEIQRK